jgi:lipocalin
LNLNTLFANNSIDAKKFSGLWYEIARVENKFQTSCVASIELFAKRVVKEKNIVKNIDFKNNPLINFVNLL